MKTIKDFNVEQKRVLVRTDFNVPLDRDGNILDNFRIETSIPTIKFLRKEGAKTILISHLGRPKGKRVDKYSLKRIASELRRLLGEKVIFFSDCIGKEVEKGVKEMKSGEVALLENLRFHKEEEENSKVFAEKISELGDFYVNDAFSVSHRSHASVVRIPKFLPAVAGLLLNKELEALSKIKENVKRPLVIILGGLKTSKLESLDNFLKIGDFVLLNGILAEHILVAKGILVRETPPDEKVISAVRKVNLTDSKLHLPKDVYFSLPNDWSYKRIGGLGTIRSEEEIFDIGPETIDVFSEIIKRAGTIFWGGPLGSFEIEKFEEGTKEIGNKIVRNYNAFKIVGGGDTIAALRKFNWLDKLDHVSTGGTAMLNFLGDEKMPGIDVLA